MIPNVLKKKQTKTFLVSIIISLVAILMLFTGLLDTWESRISDALYTPGTPLDDIIIVAIDDKSLQELGRWPWPRGHFASVMNHLNQSSVIGLDLSFFEPAEGDDKLAESLKKSTVVLAMEYTSFSFQNGNLYGESLLKPTESLGTPGIDFEIGFANLYTDSDGVTRSFTPHIKGIEDHDHFSMSIVNEFLGVPQRLEKSRMLINYFTTPGGYTHISFSDVYNNQTHPTYFKNKITLIGATAPDLHDDVIVPISNQAMPGVEVNANLVQSILTRDFLHYQDDISAVGSIILFSLVTSFLLYWFRLHIATIFVMVLGLAYIIFSIYQFDSGVIMNILYPLVSLSLTYISLVGIYYITEEKKRKWITSVFGKYVSPLVIDNLLRNPDTINLGGEKRDITLFFSDIRGFTSISEKLAPEQLIHFLNEYLTEMTEIIIKNQGLVDKYMGDAIMAFWGAPLDQANHAEVACSSSLDMMIKLDKLNKKWKKENKPFFDIGIGLNSGEAVVGNMGSLSRLDYTALGDNVNIASRLEGLNKIYGTNIIIGENTYRAVENLFEIRKLDAVKVKGKKKPILIFELLSKKDALTKKEYDFVRQYEDGLDFYFKKEWKSAIKCFNRAHEFKKDKACEVFITRCQKFLENPPPKNWDYAWEFETK